MAEHGRLIDADALIKAIADFPYGYRGMIKNVIAEQPTIHSEQRWIPVSERLPKLMTPVLLTKREIGWNGSDHTRVVIGTYNFDNHILAWMPLPEPWRGGKDEHTNT